ncbi:MAG: MFS transporter [Bacteroidota bacterium]
MNKGQGSIPFTSYQKFAVFILAITQFTVILDFMVMSPLGDMLMKSLNLSTKQFGFAVSAYAFSAGVSGLLTAGFADRFDRKKLLIFFYTGFILGTVFCGLANTYPLLLAARILTGLFGGVIGSIGMAIITDLFDIRHRGRVMGFVQMGFGASQVLGIPVGIYIANRLGWQAPFIMVALLGAAILLLIILKLAPITQHLLLQRDKSAFVHLAHTIGKRDYRIGYLTTAMLSMGGFMLMPFGSAYAINNLHITQAQLLPLFMISGVCSLITMPIIGKLSDKVDKLKIFTIASIWMVIMVLVYTNLGATPLWLVILFNVLLMMGIMSRMVPSAALTSAIPDMPDRGAFMSINASLQQVAGGAAAAFAGMVVIQKTKTSPLEHYDLLGYIMAALTMLCIVMLYRISNLIKRKMAEKVL